MISWLRTVRFGTLRSLRPVSSQFGWDRGLPIDRYYIENFLAAHSNDIRGHVLEIKDPTYTQRFGGTRVVKSDVLDLPTGVGTPTIIADLVDGKEIPSSSFDCIICTQTLQFVYDFRAALKTLHRILAPGGVLLATVPGISQIDPAEEGDYWRFTRPSCERLFLEFFEAKDLIVCAYGNVLSATSFLQGLSVEELTTAELDFRDPNYDLVMCARAVKESASA